MLSACATPVADQVTALDRAPLCCTTFAQFNFEPLAIDQVRSVKLSAERPAFQFDSGKSFFYAARLPAFTTPLVLTVDSLGVLAGEGRSSVFLPEILLLDAQYRVTRRIPAENFKRVRGADLSGNVFINAENAAEAYLVLFTRSARATESTLVKTYAPHPYYFGYSALTLDGSEYNVALPFGPIGLVTLKLQRYQPSAITK